MVASSQVSLDLETDDDPIDTQNIHENMVGSVEIQNDSAIDQAAEIIESNENPNKKVKMSDSDNRIMNFIQNQFPSDEMDAVVDSGLYLEDINATRAFCSSEMNVDTSDFSKSLVLGKTIVQEIVLDLENSSKSLMHHSPSNFRLCNDTTRSIQPLVRYTGPVTLAPLVKRSHNKCLEKDLKLLEPDIHNSFGVEFIPKFCIHMGTTTSNSSSIHTSGTITSSRNESEVSSDGMYLMLSSKASNYRDKLNLNSSLADTNALINVNDTVNDRCKDSSLGTHFDHPISNDSVNEDEDVFDGMYNHALDNILSYSNGADSDFKSFSMLYDNKPNQTECKSPITHIDQSRKDYGAIKSSHMVSNSSHEMTKGTNSIQYLDRVDEYSYNENHSDLLYFDHGAELTRYYLNPYENSTCTTTSRIGSGHSNINYRASTDHSLVSVGEDYYSYQHRGSNDNITTSDNQLGQYQRDNFPSCLNMNDDSQNQSSDTYNMNDSALAEDIEALQYLHTYIQDED